MSDLFLGIIAVAVLVMAIVQIAVVVVAARAAKHVGAAVARLERDVRPIVDTLHTISADAARVTSSAATQVERAQQTVDVMLERVESVSRRVEDTLAGVQEGILGPARDGLAFLQALRGLFGGLREASRRPRSAHTDEDDALFIG